MGANNYSKLEKGRSSWHLVPKHSEGQCQDERALQPAGQYIAKTLFMVSSFAAFALIQKLNAEI
jgi:hypothetical protein